MIEINFENIVICNILISNNIIIHIQELNGI